MIRLYVFCAWLTLFTVWAQDGDVAPLAEDTVKDRLARQVKQQLDAKVDAELEPLVRQACKNLGVEFPVEPPEQTLAELDARLEDQITEAIRDELPPDRTEQYKAEAVKLYGLAKVGDEITVQTKLGTEASGKLYDKDSGMIRIGGRRIPKRDLTEESLARFDPQVSEEMQQRHVRKLQVQDKVREERLRGERREEMKAPFYREHGYVHYRDRWVAAYDLIQRALARKRQALEAEYREDIENKIFLSNGFVNVAGVWRPLDEVRREREEIARRRQLMEANRQTEPAEAETATKPEAETVADPFEPDPPPAEMTAPPDEPAPLPMADLPPVDPDGVMAQPVEDLFEGPAVPLAPAKGAELEPPAPEASDESEPEGAMFEPDEDEQQAMDVARKQQEIGETMLARMDAGEELTEDDFENMGVDLGDGGFDGNDGGGIELFGFGLLAIIGGLVMWVVGTGVSTVSLWAAAKVTGLTSPILGCLIASVIAEGVNTIIPGLMGFGASVVALYALLYKFSDADGLFDVMIQVIVAKVLVFLVLFAIGTFVLSRMGMIG